MNINAAMRNFGKRTNRHSPAILTVIGVSGVVTTAYLSAKATWEARGRLENEAPDTPLEEKVKKVWDLYIPAVGTGAITICAIITAQRTEARRAAAALSAYTVTERAYNEYKEKVVEEIGAHKEQVLRDHIVQDKVESDGSVVILSSNGTVLCCDLYTRRYFESDMESLKKAQNETNALIMSDLYVPMTVFYEKVGLEATDVSDELGWDSDKLMELEFSTVLTNDGRPCLAFSFNYVKPI